MLKILENAENLGKKLKILENAENLGKKLEILKEPANLRMVVVWNMIHILSVARNWRMSPIPSIM